VSGVRRVIAGVSGSPGSLQAIRYAAHLARDHHAGLVPVLAWMPPGGDFADRSHPSPYLRQLWHEAARLRLQRALELALGGVPQDLSCELLVQRGEPGAVLVRAASCDGDVLVIGTGRRGAARRLLSCRVGRYCLSRARCPVIAVPPSDLARLGHGLRGWALRHRGLSREESFIDDVSTGQGP
jgi:nucleotide-binding universal stress UspA family protein